jgi:hypothetical protein
MPARSPVIPLTAQCPACDQVFADPDLFDAHRSTSGEHGACRRPADVVDSQGQRVMIQRDGIWRSLAEIVAGRPSQPTRRADAATGRI